MVKRGAELKNHSFSGSNTETKSGTPNHQTNPITPTAATKKTRLKSTVRLQIGATDFPLERPQNTKKKPHNLSRTSSQTPAPHVTTHEHTLLYPETQHTCAHTRPTWYGMVDVYDGYLAAEASRSNTVTAPLHLLDFVNLAYNLIIALAFAKNSRQAQPRTPFLVCPHLPCICPCTSSTAHTTRLTEGCHNQRNLLHSKKNLIK